MTLTLYRPFHQEYTARTGQKEFAILWVKVSMNPDGTWSVEPRQGNAEPKGDEKLKEDELRQKLRAEKEAASSKDAASDLTSALNDIAQSKRDKESAAAASDAELMASTAERERLEAARLEKARFDADAKIAADKARKEAKEAERQKAREAVRAREALEKQQNNLTAASMPHHKKIFGMWMNDKLAKSGNPPIRIADLEKELQV